jgi:hypothetical protein
MLYRLIRETFNFSTLFIKRAHKIQKLMKYCLFFFLFTLGFTSFGQELTASETDHPFFDVLEWKNNGLLLLSRDPSGNQRKITITCMTDKEFPIWQESFNPTGKEYHYISGENARYVYFLDQLELKEGKIFFHQISSAGNIKSSSALIGQAIKKIDNILFADLVPIDVFTTDKALVFTYRLHDKKEKKYTDYMVTMTHHNMVLYAAKIGSITEDQLKDPKYSYWSYSGFNEDKIYFSTRDVQDKKSGWSVQTISSKATFVESRFIEEPREAFELSNWGSWGMNGSYFLNNTHSQSGRIHLLNEKIYCYGITTAGNSKYISLYELENATWVKRSSTSLSFEAGKKSPLVRCILLNEGLIAAIGNRGNFLSLTGNSGNNSFIVSSFGPNNPSYGLIKEPKATFAVSLPGGNLCMDPSHLNKKGSIKLVHNKK